MEVPLSSVSHGSMVFGKMYEEAIVMALHSGIPGGDNGLLVWLIPRRPHLCQKLVMGNANRAGEICTSSQSVTIYVATTLYQHLR